MPVVMMTQWFVIATPSKKLEPRIKMRQQQTRWTSQSPGVAGSKIEVSAVQGLEGGVPAPYNVVASCRSYERVGELIYGCGVGMLRC